APNDIAISCPEPCTAPERAVPLRRDLIIWGAHGGAGTSTLATLLRPAATWARCAPKPTTGTRLPELPTRRYWSPSRPRPSRTRAAASTALPRRGQVGRNTGPPKH